MTLGIGSVERGSMPKRYPDEFRRKVLDLVESGRSVRQVADGLGISDESIYQWRRQDRIANGGGSTRVLVDDADEGREWTYRVSVADLSVHQPFSRFEGVDRHLTFLGPGSLRMTVNGVERTLDRWQEIRFLGEDAVASEPSEPTASDLNMMARRIARTLTVTPTAGVSIISP